MANTQERFMANLRIVHDNAVDNILAITASTTAGTLVAANLLTDIKTSVWRSTSTTASLTATWTASQLVGCVILPFTNLTSTATIRVRGYTLAADTTAIFDTGTILACPYTALDLWKWGTVSLGVNSFTYGGGAYASAYFSITSVKKLVIDIVDTDNTSAYIEASRLIAGTYWTPERNAGFGASVTPEDTTKQYRTEGGDLMTDVGIRFRKVSISLPVMSSADRASLWRIIRGAGMSKPIFFSLFPENSADTDIEQAYAVYGKLSTMSAITISNYNIYSSTIEIEEN